MGEKTLKEIDAIVGRINTHPEYSAVERARFLSHLRTEADVHSSKMEINGENGRHANSKTIEQVRSASFRNLATARDFLGRRGISLTSLSQLGYIVEPSNHPYKSFRLSDVDFGGFHAPPTTAIHSEVDNLIWFLYNTPQIHPVVRAANAHLDLVKIHPYLDGNGRAARLLQNVCLEEKGFPPAIIDADEGELYRGIMGEVLRDRYNGKSDFVKPSRAHNIFVDFIETKVLESAKALQQNLESQKVYGVVLSRIDDEHTIKRLTQGLTRYLDNVSHGHVHVRYCRETGVDGYTMEVTGDVSREALESFLGKSAERREFRFSVTSR